MYIFLGIITVICIILILIMIKGPTIWDRLLCMNELSAKSIAFIVLLSIISEQSFLLDIAIVYALFSFVSTVIVARFIKKKGGI